MDTNKLRAQLRALELQIDAFYDASKVIETCIDAMQVSKEKLQRLQVDAEASYGVIESRLFEELRK